LVDSRLEVPATVSGIADGLSKLLVDSAVLLRVAPAWRDFVAQRYAWGAIVLEYLNLYKRICTQQVSK
jgi:hypothetical protein